VVSGKRYPKSQMLSYEGRWVSAEHRDTFFQRIREGLPLSANSLVPGPHGYGGFWWRFLAKIIDGVILGIVGQVVQFVGMALMLGRTPFDPVKPDPAAMAGYFAVIFLVMAINILIGLGYTWFFVAKYQATPGKMAAGLKIVRSDGTPLSNGRIIGRHFAEWISCIMLYIGYLMAAWDPEKQALHDRICDTRVIRTRS
jgi:uncharacterized RDD family membrane protein YckC